MLQRSVPYLSATFRRTVAVAEHFGTLVPKCPDPRTEVSGPMVRTISALGPKCLSAGTGTELVPKCLGSELSCVRCVWKPGSCERCTVWFHVQNVCTKFCAMHGVHHLQCSHLHALHASQSACMRCVACDVFGAWNFHAAHELQANSLH